MVYSNSDHGANVNESNFHHWNFLVFAPPPRHNFNYQHLQAEVEEPSPNDGPLLAQISAVYEDESKPKSDNDTSFKKTIVHNFTENTAFNSEINDPVVREIIEGTNSERVCTPDTFCGEISPPTTTQSSVSNSTGECSKPIPNSGGSGGILSFFGFKFNKSSTRHLDRSSSGDSVDKTSETASSPSRYTKFPLIGTSLGLLDSCGQSKVNQSHESLPSLSCSSSSTKSIDKNQSSVLCLASAAPQSNSPFDISQIQPTAQTKVYTNPNRSPSRINRKGTSFSASTFLTSAISSLGKKTGSAGCNNKSTNSNFINRLKVKSKSDNNLHRVDLNSSASNNAAILASIGSGNLASSRGQETRREIASHHQIIARSSQNIYNPEPSSSELRLNSVQIGDHATIHLPWTGFQRNNLSGVTSTRVHQNTHSNNFDSENVRYVECGFHSSSNDKSHCRFSTGQEASIAKKLQTYNYSTCTVSRRRSKSLERDYNLRISHDLVTTSSLSSSGGLREVNSKTSLRGKWSLEGKYPENHRIRHSLTPDEQEVVLRNIKWECVPSEVSNSPPPRPEKPSNLKSPRFSNFINSIPTTNTAENKLSNFSASKPKKPPPIGLIQRSAPNSFSNSSDSNDSVSRSVPPSPPPRPLSSLKPESRLITHTSNFLPAKKIQNSGVIARSNSLVVSTSSFSEPSKNYLPTENEAPNSQYISSDSGVSHCSGSSSTCKKTCEDEQERVPIHNSSVCTEIAISQSSTSSSSSSIFSQKPFENVTMSIEEARNSGFINKPSKGWLHSDQLLSREGVTYTVRYIGCLDVNTSMKSLDFDTRSLIAKFEARHHVTCIPVEDGARECINQVCEAAGLKSVDRKRKIDRQVMRILGLRPRLDHAGSDVHLTITSTCLKLTSLDTGAVIAVHDMPNISFASGGDATMLDFIAYVAKDSVVGRACFILECGSGLAQDVIITVGQAFELRFKEYIQKRPPPPRLPNDDPEYYNDLPGKLPPDVLKSSAESSSEKDSRKQNSKSLGKLKEPPSLTLPSSSDRELSVNLIDFEAPTPPAFGPSGHDRHLESLLLSPDSANFAINTGNSGSNIANVGTGLGLPNSPSQPLPVQKDPFDMQPFAGELPKPLTAAEQKKLLETESWFHGTISRNEAETLVQNDGDFLVRESQTTAGQYVLTGIQNGAPKHLLLVDPEGVVRTKDQTFDSVIHLIHFHSDNSLPIISAESMVILRNPVKMVK